MGLVYPLSLAARNGKFSRFYVLLHMYYPLLRLNSHFLPYPLKARLANVQTLIAIAGDSI